MPLFVVSAATWFVTFSKFKIYLRLLLYSSKKIVFKTVSTSDREKIAEGIQKLRCIPWLSNEWKRILSYSCIILISIFFFASSVLLLLFTTLVLVMAFWFTSYNKTTNHQAASIGGVFFCFVYILHLPSRPFHKTAWAIRQARAHHKAEKSPKFLTRPRHAHDCTDFPQNSWADYGRAVWAECKQSWKTLPPISSLVATLPPSRFHFPVEKSAKAASI